VTNDTEGVAVGVTFTRAEAGPLPLAFAARTAILYRRPSVRPVTVHVVAPVVVQFRPPWEAVAV